MTCDSRLQAALIAGLSQLPGCRHPATPRCVFLWVVATLGLFPGVGRAEEEPAREAPRGEVESDPSSKRETGVDALADPPRASTPPSPPPTGIVLPRILEQVEAEYPPDELLESKEALVELAVVVAADGSVGDVSVLASGGTNFDVAAVKAVRSFRFVPALRAGVPVTARVRIPFHFVPPHIVSGEVTHGHTHTHEPRPHHDEPILADASPEEVTVRGAREVRAERRSSGDFHLDHEILNAAPRAEASEALRSIPGFYFGRGEGAAIAPSYSLRGFDSEHGQDIEFRIGGVPINLPAHLHGQGYADLGLLMAPVVLSVDAKEGVYDPRQGDFAVAGTIDFLLGVPEAQRGVQLRSSYGSFDTFRQTALWAPKGHAEESFGAAEYFSTSGFGQNRRGQAARLSFQHRFGEGELRYRALGLFSTARSSLAGVLRRDDVESGAVCFLCVYPEATAQAQSGSNSRGVLGFFADYAGISGDDGQLGAWISVDDFRLLSNFTGFIERSETLPGVSGRGDLWEQLNRTFSVGMTGRYRTAPYRLGPEVSTQVEVGIAGRLDSITQAQSLVDAAERNQTWDRRIDASIFGADLGLWGDVETRLFRRLRARIGVRGDALSYNTDDRLGNRAEQSRPVGSYIVGYRRSAFGAAFGPRASVEYNPIESLALLVAYGEGYRSPQPRQLADGEQAPYAKVRSVDAGAQWNLGRGFDARLGGYYTQLSDDVAFEANEGRLERIGPTSRAGALAYLSFRPSSAWLAAVSATWTDARLLAPPPPSDEEPNPPYTSGQTLPFVSPFLLRSDLSYTWKLAREIMGSSLEVVASSGFSFVAPRPLPYGELSDAFGLLDLGLRARLGIFQVDIEAFNVLDAGYAALEYSFASDWNPADGYRSRLPTRHSAAGAPRMFLLSLGMTL